MGLKGKQKGGNKKQFKARTEVMQATLYGEDALESSIVRVLEAPNYSVPQNAART